VFGFKKIIFVLITAILLLGLAVTPLTALARPENLKVAVVDWDAERWMTQVIPSFENENTGVKVEYEILYCNITKVYAVLTT
jgi:ABC-type glycerol-3-phosphate transport system substrate-binding protein